MTLIQSRGFTLRAMSRTITDEDGNEEHLSVPPEVIRSVKEAVEYSIGALQIDDDNHLFVTVLAADEIATGPGETGWGVYFSAAQHVLVAGLVPDDWQHGVDDWLEEVQKTTIHEVVHFAQELDGTLSDSEAAEYVAEQTTEDLWEGMTQ